MATPRTQPRPMGRIPSSLRRQRWASSSPHGARLRSRSPSWGSRRFSSPASWSPRSARPGPGSSSSPWVRESSCARPTSRAGRCSCRAACRAASTRRSAAGGHVGGRGRSGRAPVLRVAGGLRRGPLHRVPARGDPRAVAARRARRGQRPRHRGRRQPHRHPLASLAARPARRRQHVRAVGLGSAGRAVVTAIGVSSRPSRRIRPAAGPCVERGPAVRPGLLPQPVTWALRPSSGLRSRCRRWPAATASPGAPRSCRSRACPASCGRPGSPPSSASLVTAGAAFAIVALVPPEAPRDLGRGAAHRPVAVRSWRRRASRPADDGGRPRRGRHARPRSRREPRRRDDDAAAAVARGGRARVDCGAPPEVRHAQPAHGRRLPDVDTVPARERWATWRGSRGRMRSASSGPTSPS